MSRLHRGEGKLIQQHRPEQWIAEALGVYLKTADGGLWIDPDNWLHLWAHLEPMMAVKLRAAVQVRARAIRAGLGIVSPEHRVERLRQYAAITVACESSLERDRNQERR
jgi:hypothetical protein